MWIVIRLHGSPRYCDVKLRRKLRKTRNNHTPIGIKPSIFGSLGRSFELIPPIKQLWLSKTLLVKTVIQSEMTCVVNHAADGTIRIVWNTQHVRVNIFNANVFFLLCLHSSEFRFPVLKSAMSPMFYLQRQGPRWAILVARRKVIAWKSVCFISLQSQCKRLFHVSSPWASWSIFMHLALYRHCSKLIFKS